MTRRLHTLLLPGAVLLVALVAAIGSPPALAAGASADPASGAKPAPAKDADSSASERRAASSKFEREKLDGDAFAGDPKSSEKGGSGSSGEDDGGGSALRFVFGLVVVLAVIYGVHWLLKRWGQSRMQGVAGRAGIIDVVATTPLAQGRALHLVRVGEELVLVGATEQSITRIGELDAAALGAHAANQGNGEFQAMLSGAMVAGQPGVPVGMGGTGAAKDPFLKRFLDNLRMTTAR